MSTTDDIRRALQSVPTPPCADLTPFELVDVDAAGRVRVKFAPQPAFRNHFGNVQGGFLVAMVEVPLTLAIFVATQRLCPTIEIKTSYLAPAPIGELFGEGVVVRKGSNIVFSEAWILTADNVAVVHSTASSLVPKEAKGT